MSIKERTMNNPDFYNTIFRRKSIRKYRKEPLESSKLVDLQNFMERLMPLYEDIKTEIAILSEKDIKLLLPIRSPHYIAIYSEKKNGYLQNAGFMLQQVDLYLSANGIGACWLGLGLPQKESASRNGLEFVIAMAFGYADGPLHRQSAAEFKRKQLSEISSVNGAEELLEAVRLAPSASNTQPWYFFGSKDCMIISRRLPNILNKALYSKFNRIDIGIAMYHLWIAALHQGKAIEFTRDNYTAPKGNEYMATAYIKSTDKKLETAIFAGGCFWCMVSPFDVLEGVIEVKSGYSGGHKENPTYKDVKSQTSGHYEVVKIVYDPEIISYEKLLQAYWRQVDPTDDGGQFQDRGESYRTAIFYTTEEQRQIAEASRKAMDESGRFPGPIVTPIIPAAVFYEAEEYHQDFYKKSSKEYKEDRRISGRDEFIKKYWGDEYYDIYK